MVDFGALDESNVFIFVKAVSKIVARDKGDSVRESKFRVYVNNLFIRTFRDSRDND